MVKLNQSAGEILKRCDGQRSLDDDRARSRNGVQRARPAKRRARLRRDRGQAALAAVGMKVNLAFGCARRGGRCPGRAPTVAVGAARRLRCASRSALARRNSLHSLRSLRSDNRRESDHEARATRVPSALLRCSPPHKSPTPGTAHRAATLVLCVGLCHGGAGKAGGGCATAATLCGAEERRARGRARAARASTSDSPRLFERSERSERSDFLGGPRDRAPQGSRPEGPTAVHERRRIPARGFASLALHMHLSSTVVLRSARDC